MDNNQEKTVFWKPVIGFEKWELSSDKVVRNKESLELKAPRYINGIPYDYSFRVNGKNKSRNIKMLMYENFPELEEKIDGEIFKEIKSPDYAVSNKGRAKNVTTNTILSPSKIPAGYLRISLTINGKESLHLVHRLVAEAFIPNPDNKPEVNHLGAKDDNRVEMLEWATASEQGIHCAKFIRKRDFTGITRIDPITNEILQTYKTYEEVTADGYNAKCVGEFISGKKFTITGAYKGFKWAKILDDIIIKKEYDETLYKSEKFINLKDCKNLLVNIYVMYAVSNMARVKNILTGKFLKIDSHYRVELALNNKSKKFKIHCLMMLAFDIPNPENKPEVDHIDSDVSNNNLENLRWATRIENMNNEATRNKIDAQIEVTYPDKHKETIRGGVNVAKKLDISASTVKKYLASGESYLGYTFVKLNK